MRFQFKNPASGLLRGCKNEYRNVTIRLLKDTLNRFRLTGPEVGQILTKTLRLTSIDQAAIGGKWWQTQTSSSSSFSAAAGREFAEAL